MALPHASRTISASLLAFAFAAPVFAQQDPLQSVKDLYASAAYEDALSAVVRIDAAAPNAEAEQYRAFCLVALGRVDEADQVVQELLTARPEYRPDAADASPRIQALFATVRRRIGPALVKQKYQQARAAMERKDRDEAISQFEAMLRLADDADIRTTASVAELKELGTGFLELSRAMPAAPKPVAEAAPAVAPPPPARTNVIVPPTIIQQRLPPWIPDPSSRSTEYHGAIRVQISAEGKVTSAEMTKSVHPAYDQMLIRASHGWSYEPARKDGVPIPMEKTIEVTVAPPGRSGDSVDKSQAF
jgi:TonB family protein